MGMNGNKKKQGAISYRVEEKKWEGPVKKMVPIRKGCANASCFCTGDCQEIVGWREKVPGEV